MDKDNFKFTIDGVMFEMTDGVLVIEGSEYEDTNGTGDGPSPEYAMARRVAFEAGCFASDDDLPEVIWSAT